ncbi:MAG: primosomal protein N' [Verrucomicrobiales bacterium]|nr:primosomal protein N' [Verrucomicrobiales bacterium]
MIARVALDLALRKEFDYLVPPELEAQVEVGRRVKVPFGPREILGSIVSLAESSPQTNLRPLARVLGQQSQITPAILDLARWIATYYCCPLELALKSVLPESVRQEQEGWRHRLKVRLLPARDPQPKLTKRQQDILGIVEEWRELPLQELLTLAGTTADTVRRLEDRGLVTISSEIAERDPYATDHILPTDPLPLNPEQAVALQAILAALEPAPAPASSPAPGPEPESAAPLPSKDLAPAAVSAAAPAKSTFLLHGVTGSGKTEVYLQAIAHALGQGKGAIVLVPEISLTPQTVERFKARFNHGPHRTLVAVLHSHLSSGERHDEWQKIRQGRARIAIGARSAVFAPVHPLGLIIVDEEHEHSYKQEEAPRYHARDVAIVRAQRAGAAVVLGSATPSMESYHHARRGKYHLLELKHRADNARMPIVRVIDMRTEARKAKGPPVFSHALHEAILQRLERKEQTILFLNRRGFSTSLQCTQCGFVAGCPNCSVSLTYHRHKQRLCCHICGHEETAPTVCPEPTCKNSAIRYSGLGTERLEDALRKAFPHARIARMDSDTLQRKEDYRKILSEFRVGRTDILVGTQMIAKGLHFPNVTLVGIVYADLGLHLADFRAGERTFQLLTQVSGRAGRGDIEGEVFVQAFTPFHPAIQYARRADYVGFYEQELEFREQLQYPPVTRAALLTLRGRNEDKVRFTAEHLAKTLQEALRPLRDLVLAGPAPAPLLKAESFYRHQIMLRTKSMSRLASMLTPCLADLKLPDDLRLTVDIDPVNLL